MKRKSLRKSVQSLFPHPACRGHLSLGVTLEITYFGLLVIIYIYIYISFFLFNSSSLLIFFSSIDFKMFSPID